MADLGVKAITLSCGREITIDLHRITLREYRALFEQQQPQINEDTTIAKVCGLTVDEYLDLPQPDARVVVYELLQVAGAPLKNPNSQSASTSD